MKFKAKNLNILKPTTLSAIIVLIATLQAFGVSFVDHSFLVMGELRVTTAFIASLLLAVGILLDAKK